MPGLSAACLELGVVGLLHSFAWFFSPHLMPLEYWNFSTHSGFEELNDEYGKPIWKNRVDSWKEKKNEKKASAKKAAAKAQVPPVEEQIMEEKE